MKRWVIGLAWLSGCVWAEVALPVYPGAALTPIGDELVVAGQRLRLGYFVTDDPLDQVADHFFQRWTSEGYPTSRDGDRREQAVVSAFHTREGLRRAVVLRRHEGRTVVFSVVEDLWSLVPPSDSAALPREGTLLPSSRAAVEAGLTGQGYRRLARSGGDPAGVVWLEHVDRRQRRTAVLTEVAPGLTAALELAEAVP